MFNSLTSTTMRRGLIAQVRSFSAEMHGTTILCVKKGGHVCMIGDGQVSLGPTIIKPNAIKVRPLRPGILTGFAGSTADAFTLLERLDASITAFPNNGITRPCVELAKSWRSDKYLRRLEAVLLVADKGSIYEVTGNGDVLSPGYDGNCMAIGSGGAFALSAARALLSVDDPELTAEIIGRRSMEIASDMCVYTNRNFVCEVIEAETTDAKKGDSVETLEIGQSKK